MSKIKAVAARAGVSVATAYKVFNRNYSTRPEIRDRVMQAAEELSYVPKTSELKSKGSDSKIVALVTNEIINTFPNYIIRELVSELARHNSYLTTFYTNNDISNEKEIYQLIKVREQAFDAVIFNPLTEKRDPVIEELMNEDMPMVELFSNVYPELPSVGVDDVKGTYLAIRHLLQNGHRRILMIALNHISIAQRIEGYKKAYEELGMSVEDERLISAQDYPMVSRSTIMELIRGTRPTAILSVSENITAMVLQTLKEMSFRVPEDISLIAYDDFPWIAAQGIFAVAHPYDQLGAMLSTALSQQLDEEGTKLHVQKLVVDPYLIARDSVRVIFPEK